MIRLRELREARHMSQVRLAMELNVTQAGKSDPDIRMLCSIADLFGVSVDFLIGRSENSEYRLRADEEKFLNTYRSLDTRRREMLASYAEGLRDLNG